MKLARRHIRARPAEIDGHRFASQAEARRYATLALRLRAGEIRDLVVHPRLDMVINEQRIGRGWIELDFAYHERQPDGRWVRIFEDVKGIDTRESRLRRQVCEAVNDIKIKVVEA